MIDWEKVRAYWSLPAVQERNQAGQELLDLVIAVAGNTGESSAMLFALSQAELEGFDVQFPVIGEVDGAPAPIALAKLVIRPDEPEVTGHIDVYFLSGPEPDRYSRLQRVATHLEVLAVLEKIAFKECGLPQVTTMVSANNKRVHRLLKKVGYKDEKSATVVSPLGSGDIWTLKKEAR